MLLLLIPLLLVLLPLPNVNSVDAISSAAPLPPAIVFSPTPNAPGEWYIEGYPEGGSFTPALWHNYLNEDYQLLFRDGATGQYQVLQAGLLTWFTGMIVGRTLNDINAIPGMPANKSRKNELREQVEKSTWFRNNWNKPMRPLDDMDLPWIQKHEVYWDYYLKHKTVDDLTRIIDHIEEYAIKKYGSKNISRHHRALYDFLKEEREKLKKQKTQQAVSTVTSIAILLATFARKVALGF